MGEIAEPSYAPDLHLGTTPSGEPFSLSANLLATGRTCVLGASGSGKSYALGVLCEELCKAGVPFCILDLEGEYWGIKDRYDAIWVGDRDVCDARWNEVDLDRLVAAAPTSPPLILDFSRVDNQRVAVPEFLTRLWKASAEGRVPYLIILDEADRVVPRGGPRMDVVFEIAVRGRKRGLGLMLCTQRPSQVDSDIIGQCTVQIVGKLMLEADLRAVDPFFGEEKSRGLAQLERGQFWVLGSGKPNGELIQVRPRETSHKSETPDLTINRHARPSEEILMAIRADRTSGPPAPRATKGSGAPPVGSAVFPPKRRLAVLPLANMSPDPQDEFFADGLTEEIISELCKVPGLRVIARTSIMRFRGSTKGVSEIGAELGVGTVLEGSVRRAGSRIRVTAQLIDAATEEHLWSEKYDRDLVDVFAIQSDIANEVATALHVALPANSPRRRAPPKLSAYNAYLRGRHLWNRRSSGQIRAALRCFEEALQIDPEYPEAYSGIADCYSILVDGGLIPPGEGSPKAKAAAERALRIDDTMAEAHASLALALSREYRWEESEREFRRALELNPMYASAHQWYSMDLILRGRAAEAASELERAEEADPLSPIILFHQGHLAWVTGDAKAALSNWDRLTALGEDLGVGRFHKVVLLATTGRRDEALRLLPWMNELESQVLGETQLAVAQGFVGQREEARRGLEALLASANERYVPPFRIAWMYAALGDADNFFAWLFRSAEEQGNNPGEFLTCPIFEPMRADPRFREYRRRCALPP